MKKFLVLLLAAAMVTAITVSGGTVAYLQSSDADVNVLTGGNVCIEQIVQERDKNGGLKSYKPNKAAYPAVGEIAWAQSGITVNSTQYKVFSEGLKNVVDNIVTVKNTGNTEAYIRTIVAIEAPDYDPKDLIHINYNGTGVAISEPIKLKVGGVEYVAFVFTYDAALRAGESSAPSLMQVFLDSKATNEDCALFGDTWEILTLSQAVQAVQAEGIHSAEIALDNAFGEITADNHPWVNGANVPVSVSSADELAAAPEDDGKAALITDSTVTDTINYIN